MYTNFTLGIRTKELAEQVLPILLRNHIPFSGTPRPRKGFYATLWIGCIDANALKSMLHSAGIKDVCGGKYYSSNIRIG